MDAHPSSVFWQLSGSGPNEHGRRGLVGNAVGEELLSMVDEANLGERVLRILSDVTNSREVLRRPELPLYGSGLIDSLGTVNLILAFGEEFGITISPADFDARSWATPALVVSDVARRVAERQSEPV